VGNNQPSSGSNPKTRSQRAVARTSKQHDALLFAALNDVFAEFGTGQLSVFRTCRDLLAFASLEPARPLP
jgi:hypothetical protein